jgi:hypothetical protein
MQIIGLAMLAVFFIAVYFYIARIEGYWVTLKGMFGVVAVTAFIIVACFLAKGGAL